MFRKFFTKYEKIKEIIRSERGKEREIVEKYYLVMLEKQRERYENYISNIEKSMNKRISDEREKIQRINDVRIKELNEIIFSRNKIIKDNEKTWIWIKDILPKLMKFGSILRIDAEIKKNEADEKWQKCIKTEDDIESLLRTIEKINPKIEKLLHTGEIE